MKITINLPDPKYCNGCPCHHITPNGSRMCIQLWETLKSEFVGLDLKIIRPKICVERNGE